MNTVPTKIPNIMQPSVSLDNSEYYSLQEYDHSKTI